MLNRALQLHMIGTIAFQPKLIWKEKPYRFTSIGYVPLPFNGRILNGRSKWQFIYQLVQKAILECQLLMLAST